jgi:hypothetical protein
MKTLLLNFGWCCRCWVRWVGDSLVMFETLAWYDRPCPSSVLRVKHNNSIPVVVPGSSSCYRRYHNVNICSPQLRTLTRSVQGQSPTGDKTGASRVQCSTSSFTEPLWHPEGRDGPPRSKAHHPFPSYRQLPRHLCSSCHLPLFCVYCCPTEFGLVVPPSQRVDLVIHTISAARTLKDVS